METRFYYRVAQIISFLFAIVMIVFIKYIIKPNSK